MKIICCILLISLLSSSAAQKQGICGKVLWVEGNQMPGPGKKESRGSGIAREIHVYELVTMENTIQQNGFFTEVKARRVAIGTSKSNGSYKIELPPGEYSVFTKEPEGLFANLFDSRGAINSVTVKEGDFTEIDLTINYEAAY